MENCEYTRILTDTGVEIQGYKDNTWKPLMRQCLICSGLCCVYFMYGLYLGAPTVLVAQIRRDENSTVTINDELLSWLTSLPIISSIPYVIILLLLFNKLGRKLTLLFVCFIQIVGFIIFYNATNVYHVLISELCAGASSATTMTIAPVMIAEYTSPKYRGIFLPLKSASAFWGVWVSNAIGTFFYWKNIAIVALVCSVHFMSVLAWPESPYWLAKRGRYAEAAKSHRWLRGVNENSEKELAQLIVSQESHNTVTSDNKDLISRIKTIITSRAFYQPTLICITVMSQYDYLGKFVIIMYAIEILKSLSPDQSFVYETMLILDGVTVFSMYVGCVISRYCKRRTLLLMMSGTAITLLLTLSLYTYLAALSVIVKNDVVILALLTIFSIAVSCGPMILCTSIYGELVPLRYQNFTMIVVSSCDIITLSVLLKISPFLFKYFKMHGTFLFFAVSSTILFSILYKYLPETKDKTIQEIEKLFTKTKVMEDENKTTTQRKDEISTLIL